MHIMHCIGPGVVNCSALFENIFHKTFYFSFQWVWKKYLTYFCWMHIVHTKELNWAQRVLGSFKLFPLPF